MNDRERAGGRLAAAFLVLSIAGSVAFAAGFALDASTQILGLGLGTAFLALAGTLVVWSRMLMPHEQVADPHHPLRSPQPLRDEATASLEEGAEQIVGRRRWLVRLGYAALGFLGLAALFPIRSLGPSPAGKVGRSNWRDGLRLVREDGRLVRAGEIDTGSVVTAFPEGFTGRNNENAMANDAVMLVHVDAGALQLPAARADWAPQGFIAYSKVCTHAGCPVALYRQGPQQLFCPCHQSTFNVLDGGSVVFGPAARALPQLPLALEADGSLRAGGPLSDAVGPDTWG